ncbi:MAG: chromate resistance protein ChrB domain-containing protein [Thiotrichales bacterium]
MNDWLLLVLSLPTENATGRMRIWRALKASGAAVLRDGVYLLPAGGDRTKLFRDAADDVARAGGTAYALEVGTTAQYHWVPLFDRTQEYEQLATQIDACARDFESIEIVEAGRQVRKLRKSYETCLRIDFFGNAARNQVEASLAALEMGLAARIDPSEPIDAVGAISRCDPVAYRGRVWVTRKRPWVDRLASAWLIQRHIDRDARFLWLASPAERPNGALGFDFDGADFTHVGARVTFETLLASFDLESIPGLARLARIVHYLDVGGLPASEAAGLETLLTGMRSAITDDDALLEAASSAFDFFYRSLQEKS